MRRRAAPCVWVVVVALAASLPARRAWAGGLEYAGAGATALGRGDAVTARADDPMVLSYNPAGLAELRGRQLLLDLNLASMSACMEPIGYYGWGAYGGGHPVRFPDSRSMGSQQLQLGDSRNIGARERAYYNSTLDTVCMSQHIVPIPQLAATTRVGDKLGLGFGMLFPAATPQGQWGDNYGLIRDAQGQLRPAATRYMLMNAATLGIFPTWGAGYKLTRWLRLGAAFEWGMVWVDTTTMASLGSGTDPSNDVLAHIKGTDMFVPAVTGSVHLVPADNWDVVAAFRYQDAVNASGSVDLTTGVFNQAGSPYDNHLLITSIKQNMPWKMRAGVRYGSRLAPRSNDNGIGHASMFVTQPLHDPMQDERWDVELDAEYQVNNRNQYQQVDYLPNQVVQFRDASGAAGNPATFPDPGQLSTKIQKRWKDQVSLRAGGTYNILPGLVALSAGAHYENRGVDPDYMQIDYWPVQRFGLHAGVSVRVAGSTDIVLSYAHIFQETLVVGAPPQQDAHTTYVAYEAGKPVTTIDRTVGTLLSRTQTLPVLYEPSAGKTDGTAHLTQVVSKTVGNEPPWIVNSGTYRSGLDVVAVGIHSHF